MIILAKITWLALAALALAATLHSGSFLSLALLAALAGVPLLAAAVHLILRSRVKLRLSAPVNAAKGAQLTVQITAENPTALPLPAIGVRVEIENLLTGEKQTVFRRTGACPHRSGSAEIALSSRFCGRVRARAVSVRLYDCFWLLPVLCKAAASAAVTVQPDVFPMEVSILADTNCPDESEVYSQEKPGADMTETFQIRDYREGDSIRQIHWKLSSKFDRLISRDPSLPVTRSVLLLWERKCEKTSPAEQDAQAQSLVSLCRALLDQGAQFNISWSEDGAGCVIQEIRDMGDLIGLLPRLLSAAPYAGGLSCAEALCRAAGEGVLSHIVYIAGTVPPEAAQLRSLGRVTALVSGAQDALPEDIPVYAFDENNCASQLMQLDI